VLIPDIDRQPSQLMHFEKPSALRLVEFLLPSSSPLSSEGRREAITTRSTPSRSETPAMASTGAALADNYLAVGVNALVLQRRDGAVHNRLGLGFRHEKSPPGVATISRTCSTLTAAPVLRATSAASVTARSQALDPSVATSTLRGGVRRFGVA